MILAYFSTKAMCLGEFMYNAHCPNETKTDHIPLPSLSRPLNSSAMAPWKTNTKLSKCFPETFLKQIQLVSETKLKRFSKRAADTKLETRLSDYQ
jgi:hypothetical protein